MDNKANRALPHRLFRAARIGVLVQALVLIVVIGSTIPDWFRPLTCRPELPCWDVPGVWLILAVTFLGPPAVLLLATFWLWRRPRRWPVALPLLVDVAVIGLGSIELAAEIQRPTQLNLVLALLAMLLTAVVSLSLIVAVLLRWDSGKPRPVG